MDSKLQELTAKIYNEGVEKARADAFAILEKANKEAESILQNAKQEASRIIEQAHKEAEELKRNVTNEIKLSSRQAISSLRQQITELILTEMVSQPVNEAFSDKDFIKRMIESILKKWQADNSSGGQGVYLFLPPEDEEKLGKYFETRAIELMNKGLKLIYDEKMGRGFRIGPADGSYVISFTEEDFENFFKNYLRPRTNQLLYGGK
ncbi:MAG TPA: hypothetical protein PLH30_00270 [Bacteroidales bacterium]|nr:hypothetical protein [Bacteroidales bacterium]